jgi:hypothetical protein
MDHTHTKDNKNNNQELLLQILNKLDSLEKDIYYIKKHIKPITKSTKKMDDHIDNIMDIYSGYKAPLDYISNKFKSISNIPYFLIPNKSSSSSDSEASIDDLD